MCTNLYTAFDQVKGHHGSVCQATAQKTTKSAVSIVSARAKLTAVICHIKSNMFPSLSQVVIFL